MLLLFSGYYMFSRSSSALLSLLVAVCYRLIAITLQVIDDATGGRGIVTTMLNSSEP